jgi:hypothetical protein
MNPKTVKVKIHKKVKPAAKTKAPIPSAVAARMRYVSGDTGSGGIPWLGVVVAVGAILLVIGIAVGAKSSHNSWPQNSTPVVSQSSGQEQQKESCDMGGLTMAEWMRQHNTTNNALLKARQEGVKTRRAQ